MISESFRFHANAKYVNWFAVFAFAFSEIDGMKSLAIVYVHVCVCVYFCPQSDLQPIRIIGE